MMKPPPLKRKQPKVSMNFSIFNDYKSTVKVSQNSKNKEHIQITSKNSKTKLKLKAKAGEFLFIEDTEVGYIHEPTVTFRKPQAPVVEIGSLLNTKRVFSNAFLF